MTGISVLFMPAIQYPPGVLVYDEGLPVGQTTQLNFTGPLVTVTMASGVAVINIDPGGEVAIPSTVMLVAGEDLLAGDLVSLVAVGGSTRAFRATWDSALRRVQGVATVAALTGANVLCVTLGSTTVRLDGALAPGDLGQVLYLSATPGCASPVVPVGSGKCVVEVGVVQAIPGGVTASVLFRPQFVAMLL